MFRRRRYSFEKTRANKPEKAVIEKVKYLQYFPETMSVSFEMDIPGVKQPKRAYWTWIGKVHFNEKGCKNIKYHDCENMEGEIVSYYEFIEPMTLYWVALTGEEVNMVTNSKTKNR